MNPDIAVFAKAISNGYPMAAIIGRGEVMNAAQDTFVSSTYWTERIGPVAALATIRKHRRIQAPKRLQFIGESIQRGWREAANRVNLPISVGGLSPLAFFTIDHPDAQILRTYFTERMLDHGYLAVNAFYAMCAHTKDHVDGYLHATELVFGELQRAIESSSVSSLLKHPVAHSGFARLA